MDEKRDHTVKKAAGFLLAVIFISGMLADCSGGTPNKNTVIIVVSREEDSSTRGAFIELFGIKPDHCITIRIFFPHEPELQ